MALANALRLRVYGVLAVVLGAIVTMLAVDLVTAVAVSRHSEALSVNAIRSVELADDIRWQIAGIVPPHLRPAGTSDTVERTFSRLAADIRAYEPLATFENERPEWLRLRGLAEDLKADLAGGDSRALEDHAQHANVAVEHLVQINAREASVIGDQMVALRRRQVIINGIAGAITLLVVLQFGAFRLKAVERERLLTEQNLALVREQNRQLEAFAGRAAHDLRGPLAPIRGFADVIARGGKTREEMIQLGGRISACVVRMAQIIDAMLDLSGSGQLPAGRASVQEAVREISDELAPSLTDGALVCTTVGDEEVACAPHVLGQILRNLVGNALKYRSPRRAPRVEVRTEVEGGFVVVEVSDNGVGMSPDSARRAFEPFFRASTDVAGHGLGLAIVESYVRASGGAVELRSEVGVGTNVTFRVPRAPVSEPSGGRQATG
jgi:signal transduction histidine kinase